MHVKGHVLLYAGYSCGFTQQATEAWYRHERHNTSHTQKEELINQQLEATNDTSIDNPFHATHRTQLSSTAILNRTRPTLVTQCADY